MRATIGILLLVIGLLTITAGVALMHVPAALIVGGSLLSLLSLFAPVKSRPPNNSGGAS